MARSPQVAREPGIQVRFEGIPQKDAEGNDKRDEGTGDIVWLYPPWPAGDYVLFKGRKNGFINQQARFMAQHIPTWATPDVVKSMDAEEFAKISWRSDMFAATTIFEMLDHESLSPPGPWVLHDRFTGKVIEPVLDVKSLLNVFEDYEVSYLLDQIDVLGRGIQPEPPTKDVVTGATFQRDGATGVPGDGQDVGPSGGTGEAPLGAV